MCTPFCRTLDILIFRWIDLILSLNGHICELINIKDEFHLHVHRKLFFSSSTTSLRIIYRISQVLFLNFVFCECANTQEEDELCFALLKISFQNCDLRYLEQINRSEATIKQSNKIAEETS